MVIRHSIKKLLAKSMVTRPMKCIVGEYRRVQGDSNDSLNNCSIKNSTFPVVTSSIAVFFNYFRSAINKTSNTK